MKYDFEQSFVHMRTSLSGPGVAHLVGICCVHSDMRSKEKGGTVSAQTAWF